MTMAAEQDPRNLHDLAVDIQTDLQKLATGLAHAGANPQSVQEITGMATVISQVVKVLGQGPVGGEAGAGAPPPGAGPGGPPPGPAGPPPGAPPGPPPGPPQGAGPPPGGGAPPPHEQLAQHSMQAATQHLKAAMVQSRQQREAQPQP